jgi:putative peptidoglycan lipid II flippase
MIRPWTQVFIGLAGVATCVGLNLAWAQRLGLRGVALSAVLSQLQSALIAALVVRRLLRADASTPRALSSQLLLPVGVLAAGVLLARVLVPASLYESSHRLWALACGFAAVPSGLAAFALAWRLGLPEAVDIVAKLRGRLARPRRLREP